MYNNNSYFLSSSFYWWQVPTNGTYIAIDLQQNQIVAIRKLQYETVITQVSKLIEVKCLRYLTELKSTVVVSKI